VTGVTTPALALASLARQRREPAGAAVAYVALNPGATCLAIARDGVLLFSREVTWGYVPAADAGAAAARVVTGLQRLMQQFMTTSAIPVAAIRLAGDPGALRDLETPLCQALGIKADAVEPLTALDTRALSQPADTFAADALALRLAIAAAADRVPAVNLLPASLRAPRRRYAALAGVAAAVATVLLLAGCYWHVPASWF
jgi:Tfp pilus assembly PilM family ATPase